MSDHTPEFEKYCEEHGFELPSEAEVKATLAQLEGKISVSISPRNPKGVTRVQGDKYNFNCYSKEEDFSLEYSIRVTGKPDVLRENKFEAVSPRFIMEELDDIFEVQKDSKGLYSEIDIKITQRR